jgi:hypothetical protein
MLDCDWDLSAGALVRHTSCREVLDRFHHSLGQTPHSVPFLGRASSIFFFNYYYYFLDRWASSNLTNIITHATPHDDDTYSY